MFEHLNEEESFSLILVGTVGPALIFGGLAAVAIGVYRGLMTGDWLLPAVILGGGATGGGCGMLASLGFYHWHRWTVVESQRATDKMPFDAFEEE
jgi:hypothetical protein